jgi:ArsR family transcriptional regulator
MDARLERQVNLLHAGICQAMADPKRILILYALSDGPKYVYELAETLDTPQPTVSRHLKTLRERKVVNAERDGTSVRYSLADCRVIEALDIMRSVLRDMLARDAELADRLA